MIFIKKESGHFNHAEKMWRNTAIPTPLNSSEYFRFFFFIEVMKKINRSFWPCKKKKKHLILEHRTEYFWLFLKNTIRKKTPSLWTTQEHRPEYFWFFSRFLFFWLFSKNTLRKNCLSYEPLFSETFQKNFFKKIFKKAFEHYNFHETYLFFN